MGSITPKTTIIDKDGEASLFHGIPLKAVKKATYAAFDGSLYNLLKMTVNGIRYNFLQTAKNGVVIFRSNYSKWEFVAPDDRLRFADYADLTVGEAMTSVVNVIENDPVPAWDTFAVWLNSRLGDMNEMMGNVYATYLSTLDGSSRIQMNPLVLSNITSFDVFLKQFANSLSPAADQPMSAYMTSDISFDFVIVVTYLSDSGAETDAMSLDFTFRQ